MNNIDVFNDTQHRIAANRKLKALTVNAIDNTYVIEEGFSSKKNPNFENEKVSFEENLSLITAFRFADLGRKTAVLNFANPVEPGGGVWRGANAQEEYLCRASNLYPCLKSTHGESFYQYHNELLKMNQFNGMFIASDRILYSSDVTFFREDKGYQRGVECTPTQEYSKHWRSIDVITCAAPFFVDSRYLLSNGDLYHLFCRRIRNILEVAIENDVESLILGAFGCGEFHNPPSIVAKAFCDVLLEKRYLHSFSDVVFSVKRSGWFCENIESFEITFQTFPPTGEYVFSTERNKRRFFE